MVNNQEKLLNGTLCNTAKYFYESKARNKKTMSKSAQPYYTTVR